MSKAEQKVEGEILANVEVKLVGVFPASWSSFELPSIIQQILARGLSYSPHGDEMRVEVAPIGTSSITSHEVPPCSCGHSYEVHLGWGSCLAHVLRGRCDCEEYNSTPVEEE